MSRSRKPLALAAVAALGLGAALAGCSSEPSAPELSVLDPYIPVPAAADVAAGYFTVRNDGGTADRLVKVTSRISGDVTMHRSSATKMEKVDGFDIPANGELNLSRGGNHLMFTDLRSKPVVGERVELELHFATSGPIDVEVPVQPVNYRPPQDAPDATTEHEHH